MRNPVIARRETTKQSTKIATAHCHCRRPKGAKQSQIHVLTMLSLRGVKRRSNLFIFLAFIMFSLFLFIPHAHATSVDDAVKRIQKHFSAIKDIKGKFHQTSYIKDIEETQKFDGVFFYKKPSYMMWEYESPRDEKVVIKDEDTWIYKKSENQVIRTKFRKESYSQVPIAMIGNMENINNDFDITMPEKNALQLVPKHRIGFLKTLVMELTDGEFPVKMFTIIDTYGNIIMIELENIVMNPGLNDAMFTFTPPTGVEVFDLSK